MDHSSSVRNESLLSALGLGAPDAGDEVSAQANLVGPSGTPPPEATLLLSPRQARVVSRLSTAQGGYAIRAPHRPLSTPPPQAQIAAAAAATHLADMDTSLNVVPASPSSLTACAFILFVLGPPGAGKSAVCQRLSSELGFLHLDVEALLDEEVQLASNAGRIIRDFRALGQDVPGEVVVDLLQHHIGRHLAQARSEDDDSLSTFFCVEHFPRDLHAWRVWQRAMSAGMAQVMRFEFAGRAIGGGLACAMELDATPSVCIERLTRRAAADSVTAAPSAEQRVSRYDEFIRPLLRDLATSSLSALGPVSTGTTSLDNVWRQVHHLVSDAIMRISLTPPLPSDLMPLPLISATVCSRRRRLLPLFILGGPGSGRSTLARQLSAEFGFAHIDFADLAQRDGNERRVAVELLLEIMEDHLERGRTLLLIDGFPLEAASWRTLADALWPGTGDEDSESHTASLRNHVTGVYLSCSESVRHARLLRRRGALDAPPVIEGRMRSYERLFEPVETTLLHTSPTTLRRIDATRDEASVAREAAAHLAYAAANIELEGDSTDSQLSPPSPLSPPPPHSSAKEDASESNGATTTTTTSPPEKDDADGGSTPSPLTSSPVLVARRSAAQLIFLFGPNGSGKQYLAARIVREYSVVHLDLDALVQRAIANRSTHRAAILQHMREVAAAATAADSTTTTSSDVTETSLLPSHIALDLLSSAIASLAQAGGSVFVVSGFPRSRAQCEAFAAHMSRDARTLKCFYFATATPDATGALDGIGVADDQLVCLERLASRGDHFGETNARMKAYFQHTRPMLDEMMRGGGNGEEGALGAWMRGPMIVLHAGRGVSKEDLFAQASSHLRELQHLRLPPELQRTRQARDDAFVLFVVGGRGAGKRGVIERILRDFDFVHLDADQLLQTNNTKTSSIHAAATSEKVARLIQQRVQQRDAKAHFLVTGFPLDESGWRVWCDVMGPSAEQPTTIYLDCPESSRRSRLLSRGEDAESVRRALTFFVERTRPLVSLLDEKGSLIKVDASRDLLDTYDQLQLQLENVLHSRRTTDTNAESETANGAEVMPEQASEAVSAAANGETKPGTVTNSDAAVPTTAVRMNGPEPTLSTRTSQVGFSANEYASLRYNLLFIFGSPGAGVTAQMRRLRAEIAGAATSDRAFSNLHFVSMQDLVRDAVANEDSALGRSLASEVEEASAKGAAADFSLLFPLHHLSSATLAQLLQQHLESLLTSSIAIECGSSRVLSKVNVVIDGFPVDERGWEELMHFLKANAGGIDLRHQIYFDAPEHVRIERLLASGALTRAQVHARLDEFNTRLLPLVQRIASHTLNATRQTSLITITAATSEDVVYLQLISAIRTKFGVYAPAIIPSHRSDTDVWLHPYGLHKHGVNPTPQATESARPTAKHAPTPSSRLLSSPLAFVSAAAADRVHNQVLFVVGSRGSGCGTLCHHLDTEPFRLHPHDAHERAVQFRHIDVDRIYREHCVKQGEAGSSQFDATAPRDLRLTLDLLCQAISSSAPKAPLSSRRLVSINWLDDEDEEESVDPAADLDPLAAFASLDSPRTPTSPSAASSSSSATKETTLFVVSGFPRDAREWAAWIKESDGIVTRPLAFLHLDVDPLTATQRLTTRGDRPDAVKQAMRAHASHVLPMIHRMAASPSDASPVLTIRASASLTTVLDDAISQLRQSNAVATAVETEQLRIDAGHRRCASLRQKRAMESQPLEEDGSYRLGEKSSTYFMALQSLLAQMPVTGTTLAHLVFMVGPPGSGVTSLSARVAKSHEGLTRIDLDALVDTESVSGTPRGGLIAQARSEKRPVNKWMRIILLLQQVLLLARAHVAAAQAAAEEAQQGQAFVPSDDGTISVAARDAHIKPLPLLVIGFPASLAEWHAWRAVLAHAATVSMPPAMHNLAFLLADIDTTTCATRLRRNAPLYSTREDEEQLAYYQLHTESFLAREFGEPGRVVRIETLTSIPAWTDPPELMRDAFGEAAVLHEQPIAFSFDARATKEDAYTAVCSFARQYLQLTPLEGLPESQYPSPPLSSSRRVAARVPAMFTASRSSTAPPVMRLLFLLGAPGSGVRTFFKRIRARYDFAVVNLAELVAHEISKEDADDNEDARMLAQCAAEHTLLPDELAARLVVDSLLAQGGLGRREFLMVGFPQTQTQWSLFISSTRLPSTRYHLSRLLFFDAPERDRWQRMSTQIVLDDTAPPDASQRLANYNLHTKKAMHELLAQGLLTRVSNKTVVSNSDAPPIAEQQVSPIFEEICEQYIEPTWSHLRRATLTRPASVEQPVISGDDQKQTDLNKPPLLIHPQPPTTPKPLGDSGGRLSPAASATSSVQAASDSSLPSLDPVMDRASRAKLEGEYLHLRLSASHLDKPDLLSTANPFFELYRFIPDNERPAAIPPPPHTREEEEKQSPVVPSLLSSGTPLVGRWEQVHQSAAAIQTLSPQWASALLDNDYLTSRHLDAPIICIIRNWTKGESAKFMAGVRTSVRALIEAAASGAELPLQTRAHFGPNGGIDLLEPDHHLSTRVASRSTLSVAFCARLIYRPLEEVLSHAPRPPSVRGDAPRLPIATTTNNNTLSVPVIGSFATTTMQGALGVHMPPSFATISAAALAGLDRVYDESECVVRLALIGDLHSAVSSFECRPSVDIYGLSRDAQSRAPFWRLAHSTDACEVGGSTRSLKWPAFVLRVHHLCENDYYRPLLIRVWNRVTGGGAGPSVIGEVQTTLKAVLMHSTGHARLELTRARGTATTPTHTSQLSAFDSQPLSPTTASPTVGSITFTYARVLSDIAHSQVDRQAIAPTLLNGTRTPS